MEINMLYKVSGGPWGGDRINDAFIQLLRDVFGEDLEYFNEGPKYEITFRIAYLI
jgi:hypothetical protein